MSSSSARVSMKARRASDSRAAQLLARAGLTARGVIYILIGIVALLAATGQGGHQADQQGALQLVASQPFGLVALWLLAIGFVGYALWRFSEAAFGVTGEGTGAGPRLKSLVRGLVYAGFAVLTFKVITGKKSNQSGQQQDFTAGVMHHTGGRFLIGIVGLIIVIVGLALVAEGARHKFMKHLRTGEMSAQTRKMVKRLGTVGTIARGLVFALAGVLVIDAAITYNASKAGGLDTSLHTLRNAPFGEFLLIIAALGLIAFGIYGLAEARWRKV
ncbi:MAG: hypothetical protein QOG05_1361 [Streptosporangiaceae bacterium]|jgi:hypothetical protein|nr:hypothetical protein [Streptosporangiaceae bacterium]